MRALPPHRPMPVAYVPPPVPPTHQVHFWYHRKSDIRDLLGVLTFDLDRASEHERLERINARLRYRLHGGRLSTNVVPLEEMRQRQRLSDLERFRRKMLRVQRAYESDRADIERGASGLFQEERLRELDALLEQTWQKMERRYGCKREDLHDEQLRAKAEALRATGRLKETDYYETAGA